jgi:hypothetical protein
MSSLVYSARAATSNISRYIWACWRLHNNWSSTVLSIRRWTLLQPQRIVKVHRIIADMGVEVQPAGKADRVGLQKASKTGMIGARLVVVEAGFGQKRLAGILEAPGVAEARPSERVIAVDAGGRARAIGDCSKTWDHTWIMDEARA